jgi:hypothetical protein
MRASWITVACWFSLVFAPISAGQEVQPEPAARAQPAHAPSAEAENRVTVQGTVSAVDYDKRTVTVRGRLGQVVTLDIPPTVTGLEQIKVGDLVTTTYFDRVNVRVKPAGEPAVDRIVEPTVTPRPGAVPGATVSRQREATVTITAWDPKTRTVVFTGPQGTVYTRTVSESIGPAVLKALKPGERVDITWTEAMEITVQPGTMGDPNQLPPADPEREFNPTQEVAAEKPEGPSIPVGPAKLRVGGYLGITALYRDVNGGGGTGTSFGSIPYEDKLQGNVSETRLTAQPSRISIRVDADFNPGEGPRFRKLGGYFEMDFNGSVSGTVAVTSTSVGFRLRHAFGEAQYGSESTWLLAAGQSFTLMTPMKDQLSSWPSDVEMSQAVDTNYLAGMVWGRIPGVRVTWRPSQAFNWAFSVENPEQQLGRSLVTLPECCASDIDAQYNTGADELNVPNLMPDFHTRVAFNGFGALHVDVGGVFRVFRHQLAPYDSGHDERASAGGVNVNSSFRLGSVTKLLGQVAAGSGIGRYIGGLVPDAAFTADGSIEPIDAMCYVVGLEQKLSNTLSVAGYYSGVETDAATLVDTTGSFIGHGFAGSSNSNNESIREGTFTFGWQPFKIANRGSVQLNTQLSWLERKPFDRGSGPASAKAFMFFAQLRYNLP